MDRLIDTLETRQMNSASPAVVGYLPDYSTNAAVLAKLDYSTLTEINYFSVVPDSNGNFNSSSSLQTTGGGNATLLQQAVAAAHGHNDKINIVVGGASKAESFENVFGSATKRNNFAQSIAAFANKFGFDGVDLDYEVAGDRGVTQAQRDNYGLLVAAVDSAIGNLKLTVAIQPDQVAKATPIMNGNVQAVDENGHLKWGEPDWNTHYWMLSDSAIPHVDRIGVMSYDYSPGAGNADETKAMTSMNNWVDHAIANGGSREQVLLGLPFYGKAGPSTWSGSGPTGEATYGDILRGHAGGLPDASLTSCVSTVADTGQSGELDNVAATWFYDNPAMIQDKTSKAVQANVGGVMIWDVTQDYYTDQVQANGTHGDEVHSLMPAIKRGLGGTTTVPPTVPPSPPSGPVDTHTARILGNVFYDGYADGRKDGSDWGEQNRVVFLDTNNNGVLDTGEKSATTDEDGNYAFEELAAGTYHVRMQVPSWNFCTTQIQQDVTLRINEDVFDVDFGECAKYRRR